MEDFIISALICCFLAVAVLFGFYGIAGRASTIAEVACIAFAVLVALVFATVIILVSPGGEGEIVYGVCIYMSLIATVSAAAPRISYRSLFGGDYLRIAFLFRLSAYIAVIVALGSLEFMQTEDVTFRFGLITLVFVLLFYGLFAVERVSRRLWVVVIFSLPLCYLAAIGFAVAYGFVLFDAVSGATQGLGDLLFAPLGDGSITFSMWISMHLFYGLCWIGIRVAEKYSIGRTPDSKQPEVDSSPMLDSNSLETPSPLEQPDETSDPSAF